MGQPCLGETKNVTVPYVPLATHSGPDLVQLVVQGLNVGQQNTGHWSVAYSGLFPSEFFHLLFHGGVCQLLESTSRRISFGQAEQAYVTPDKIYGDDVKYATVIRDECGRR